MGDGRRYIRRFPLRPSVFVLGGRATRIACCSPTRRAGWLLQFRDHGRGFYAYVHGDTTLARRYARQALGTLVVEGRA